MGLSLLMPQTTALIDWSEPFFKFCQTHSPSSPYSYFYSSLVCGTSLPAGALKSALADTSLLHLFVVSGSHLLFLEFFLQLVLKKMPHRSIAIALLLFLYGVLVNLQAPVLRALLGFGFAYLNRLKKYFWRAHTVTFLSGTLCLCLVPLWSYSYSLLLSWTTSLVLAVAQEQAPKDHSLIQSTLIYVFLLPVLLSFNCPAPTSIIFNVIAAPVLGFLLFPLSLVCFFIPWLTSVADLGVEILIKTLVLFDQPSSFDVPDSVSIKTLWCYLLLLHGLAHLISLRWNKDE